MENQQQNKNPLENLSLVELKSLAYDNLNRIQQSQLNLQILNQEIDSRIKSFQQNQQQNQQQTQQQTPSE